MLTEIRFENFRSFDRLLVVNPGRINVVVGDNGVGKTAFLEGLFLPGGHPELALRLNNWRGLNFSAVASSRLEYESLWRDLFFKFDQSKTIRIKLTGTPENHREVAIFYSPLKEPAIAIPIEKQRGPTGATGPDSGIVYPLTFETTDKEHKKYSVQAVMNPNGTLAMTGQLPPVARIQFHPTTAILPIQQVAQMFSELSKRNEERLVIQTIADVFPLVRDISVQTAPGGVPSLYCTVSGLSEKVPVGHVSTGLTHLLGFLLGIANSGGGVVLIDEIENGFYYLALPKMWEAIYRFCERYDVQLFASTHSRECLNSVLPVLNRNPEDFRLLRFEKEDGKVVVRSFSGAEFTAALETEVEVR